MYYVADTGMLTVHDSYDVSLSHKKVANDWLLMLVINTLASLELDAVLEFHDKQLDMGISDFFFHFIERWQRLFFFLPRQYYLVASKTLFSTQNFIAYLVANLGKEKFLGDIFHRKTLVYGAQKSDR